MVQPMATPKKLAYWMHAQRLTFLPPGIQMLMVHSQRRAKRSNLAELTEIRTDFLHVVGVAFPGDGVTGAVAVGKKDGRIIRDGGEEENGDGARDPTELRNGPRQREHAGADHRRDDVRACRQQNP